MIATLRRLLALAGAPRSRVALAVGLGAATVLFGTALLATSGYLISRAAERPAILSLSVAIVGVRFFGLGRPVLRYAERLASHDLAFRVLARVRARAYARMEPLAPAGLEAFREGELLSTAVADVDSLQNLHLRAVGPPLVAVVAGTIAVAAAAVFLPARRPRARGRADRRCDRRARGRGGARPAGRGAGGGRARSPDGRARRADARRPGARALRAGGRAARARAGRTTPGSSASPTAAPWPTVRAMA